MPTIETSDPATNLAYFRRLEAHRAEYETKTGMALEWEALEGRKSCRVALSRPVSPGTAIDTDPELMEWAVTTMLALNNAFRADIRRLPTPPTSAVVTEQPA